MFASRPGAGNIGCLQLEEEPWDAMRRPGPGNPSTSHHRQSCSLQHHTTDHTGPLKLYQITAELLLTLTALLCHKDSAQGPLSPQLGAFLAFCFIFMA